LTGLAMTTQWPMSAIGNKRKADLYDIRAALRSKGARSALRRTMERQLKSAPPEGKIRITFKRAAGQAAISATSHPPCATFLYAVGT
ncbi:MAG: hypothetical protein WB019_14525, partial [Pseudolabrys sp.]